MIIIIIIIIIINNNNLKSTFKTNLPSTYSSVWNIIKKGNIRNQSSKLKSHNYDLLVNYVPKVSN